MRGACFLFAALWFVLPLDPGMATRAARPARPPSEEIGICPRAQPPLWSPFYSRLCDAGARRCVEQRGSQRSQCMPPPVQMAVSAGANAEERTAPGPRSSAADAKAKQKYPRFAHAIAGAGGGLATVLLLHPLDTVKTHLQSDSAARSGGVWRMFRTVVATQGVAGLYRGAVPAMVGSVSSWAFYMHWFHSSRALIGARLATGPAPWSDFVAGVSAGLLTAVATNPIWVVKVRLQLQQHDRGFQPHDDLNDPKAASLRHLSKATRPGSTAKERVIYTGFLDGLRRIAKDEGLRGLYKGLGPSLWLVSHGAIQFTLYEHFKRALSATSPPLVARLSPSSSTPSNDTSAIDSLVASTASKLVAAAATYPIQLVRTRMQELGPTSHHYRDLLTGFSRVMRVEGARGLYRGFGANVARVVPQSAVTFVTYEQILSAFAFAKEKGLLPGS